MLYTDILLLSDTFSGATVETVPFAKVCERAIRIVPFQPFFPRIAQIHRWRFRPFSFRSIASTIQVIDKHQNIQRRDPAVPGYIKTKVEGFSIANGTLIRRSCVEKINNQQDVKR